MKRKTATLERKAGVMERNRNGLFKMGTLGTQDHLTILVRPVLVSLMQMPLSLRFMKPSRLMNGLTRMIFSGGRKVNLC